MLEMSADRFLQSSAGCGALVQLEWDQLTFPVDEADACLWKPVLSGLLSKPW